MAQQGYFCMIQTERHSQKNIDIYKYNPTFRIRKCWP